jgi:SAM-dependent methyltransferase
MGISFMQVQESAAFLENDRTRTCGDGLLLLDEVSDAFASGLFAAGMARLVSGLHEMKKRLPPNEWAQFTKVWGHHPVVRIAHQDPFTSWCYRKPRGYPGDARLLDFIYRSECVRNDLEATTDCGRAIYRYTVEAPGPVAVRERRDILTKLVDRVAEERASPIDVLAIAAGHLRESQASRAARQSQIERWVALDQDEDTVASVRAMATAPCIQPMLGSVRGLLGRRYNLGKFDLIYAAGLYDYLTSKVAKRLTEIAFSMLKPGGVLLYANVAQDIPDDGYMETFMDWHLLYRGMSDMEDIAAELPSSNVADRQFFHGCNRNLIYAVITKT